MSLHAIVVELSQPRLTVIDPLDMVNCLMMWRSGRLLELVHKLHTFNVFINWPKWIGVSWGEDHKNCMKPCINSEFQHLAGITVHHNTLCKELYTLNIHRCVSSHEPSITPSNKAGRLGVCDVATRLWTTGKSFYGVMSHTTGYSSHVSNVIWWMFFTQVYVKWWWCTCLGVFFAVWPGTFACCSW